MKNRLKRRRLFEVKKEGRKAYFFWQFSLKGGEK